jgi:RNA polymerase sigma-70 factor (ECF subfamily)
VSIESSPSGASVEALGDVYRRHYRRYLRVAEAIVGEVELAHDAVQDAFARAIKGHFENRGPGSLEGWVWRTVVNSALSTRRDRPPTGPQLDAAGELASVADGSPDRDLRPLVAALPERQRLVLFLRYYADLDYARIGEVLGIQPGTVAATLNQAHAALRGALQEVTA